MNRIGELRSQIYGYLESSTHCQQFFFSYSNEDVYAQYYTSMYLLQDSTEGIQAHMDQDFSRNPLIAYIEMWGIMQAVIIQQDAIATLYKIIMNKKLSPKKNSKWAVIRRLRNQCGGHPGDNNGRFRSFIGRTGVSYENFRYERKDNKTGTIEHPTVNYIELLGTYATEAARYMEEIVNRMPQRWPDPQ